MINALQQFVREDEGVDAIEYGIIAALIFIVILVSVGAAATQATGLFTTIANSMP